MQQSRSFRLLALAVVCFLILVSAQAAALHDSHYTQQDITSHVPATSGQALSESSSRRVLHGSQQPGGKASVKPRSLFDPLKQKVHMGGGWLPGLAGAPRTKPGVLTVESLSEGHGPSGKCASGCTKHGVCNQELGRCDCPRGFHGADCSQPPSDMARVCKETHFHHYKLNCTDSYAVFDTGAIVCVNACNGRGRCRAGWCHCKPGYWGADCSLSMSPEGRVEVLAGQNYVMRKKRPLIYVYDLPPRLTTWRNPHFTDRPLHLSFWQRLLGAGVLTADGDQADYFLFPMSVRGPSEGLLLEAAVDYVRKYWPYWDRHHGARHLVIHTGDTGRSELTGRTLRITANCTFLTHWGLYQEYPYSGWPASHVLDRDIVIPIFMSPMGGRSAGLQMSPHHPQSTTRFSDTKDIQLLFAGRICGGREEPDGSKTPNCRPISKGYSQGVRQEVHQHHWNRTGFRISVSNPSYFMDLMRTRFCLAPTGGGHGHRQILVAFSGCTPLIISDFVLQPFEPALNWTRFAVTLPQSSIPDLHTILPRISDARFKEMQAALPCAAQHFTWSSSVGGFMHEDGRYDAFETTMEILRMSLKYPGVPHSQYEAIDPEFKAFMECRSEEYVASQAGNPEVHRPRTLVPTTLKPTTTLTTTETDAAVGSSSSAADAGVAGSTESALRRGRRSARGPRGLRRNRRRPLCSISKWDSVPIECEECLTKYRRLPPGGALCCGFVGNLTACPRLWE